MALEVHQVARLVTVATPEEVVKAHFIQRGSRGEGREMSPQVVIALVSSNHHGDCVPADKGTNVALDIRIPWALNFFRHRDRVAIGRGNGGWLLDTEIGGRFRQLLDRKSTRLNSSHV